MSANASPSPSPPPNRTRVTLDLDGYRPGFETRAVRAWHALDRECYRVDVAISSGGQGLHMVGWYDRDLGLAEHFQLREALGDDPARIELDIQRLRQGHVTQTLWARKDDREKTRGFEDVYEALDEIHARQDTLDPERVKRLANEGHKADPELARLADGL